MSGAANFWVIVFRKRCCDASPRRTSMIFKPYLRRISKSIIVLPKSRESFITCKRNRLLESPYSFTNCFSDLPERLLSSFWPFFERNHLLSGINTSVPTITQTMPTGRKEKKESGSSPAEVNVFCITRFGGVPIKVIIPPILLAKANGINSLLGFIPALIARLTTIGSISATVPVLLTNAPMAEVTNITNRNNRISLVPASLRIRELIIFANPV